MALPLSAFPKESARSLQGLLFDLDDTVLDHGSLSPLAFSALFALQNVGLKLVAVTGRPAAWGQVLLRQWPLDGVVTENGLISLKQEQGRVVLCDRLPPSLRHERSRELDALINEIRQRWPLVPVTDDNFGRVADRALDIAETVTIDEETVDQIREFARVQGARTVRSSIQLHISFDVDDKATGTLRFLSETLRIDPTLARYRFAYIGDSQNDAPCFAGFEHTFGVANLSGHFSCPPRYLTPSERGLGFTELASVLSKLRD